MNALLGVENHRNAVKEMRFYLEFKSRVPAFKRWPTNDVLYLQFSSQ